MRIKANNDLGHLSRSRISNMETESQKETEVSANKSAAAEADQLPDVSQGDQMFQLKTCRSQREEKKLTAPGIPKQSPIRRVQGGVAISNSHCDKCVSYRCWNHMFSLFYQIIGLRGWCWSCICSSLMGLFSAAENETLRKLSVCQPLLFPVCSFVFIVTQRDRGSLIRWNPYKLPFLNSIVIFKKSEYNNRCCFYKKLVCNHFSCLQPHRPEHACSWKLSKVGPG